MGDEEMKKIMTAILLSFVLSLSLTYATDSPSPVNQENSEDEILSDFAKPEEEKPSILPFVGIASGVGVIYYIYRRKKNC